MPLFRPGNMSVETFPVTFISRPVRDGMSVENAGCPSGPVPSGTECERK
ncbi:MAG: hypothetical protein LBJ47_04005 [Tannerella sp.]|nr:hypothetical protein [Tannerella sp.]